MRVLGVDPGSIVCGFGVIEKNGKSLQLIEYGIIEVKKKNELLPQRLKDIFLWLNTVIERTKPDVSAFESVFFSKNVQSLAKLSHARGSAIVAATMHNLPVAEYSPREVKKAVTGNGNAGKQQVQFMVKTLLKIQETPDFFDATDALAVAICHALRTESPQKTAKSWSDWVKQNPERISKK